MGIISRREFLTVLGVAAGGGALAFAPDAAVKVFNAAWGEDWQEVPHGAERWIASLCQQCPGGCGIRVRLIGDRPVKIEGNPLHPVNRGKLCPKGQAGLLSLNDPDRIRGPLKSVGGRGSGKWEAITWDEAISLTVNRLKDLRTKRAVHKLAFMDGESSGVTRMIIERFLHHFGSPNYIALPTGLDYGCGDASYLMQGLKDGIAYDMEMANYILSFDADILQTFWSPVQVMNAFGYMRRGKGIRGKIVQVESRLSVTAAKADTWIPITPGTEGVLALGMAHFIVKEGLYDKEFVEKHTFGFEDWRDQSGVEHRGYKNLVLQNYSPSVVSEITGVPVESLLGVAKEFATQGPALAVGARGDIYQQMAIHALNALVGNIDKPGGVLTAKNLPVLELPAPPLDAMAQTGLHMAPIACDEKDKFPLAECALPLVPERIISGKPYDISVLFLHNANPLFTSVHMKDFPQAIGKIPFIVSFSPYMDETTANADLILPDHACLEKWQSNLTYTFQGYPVVGIGKPVVSPRYNTGHTGDVIMKIAKGIDKSLASVFPWNNTEEVLSDTMKKVFELSKGDLFAPEMEETLLRELVRRGWRAPGYHTFAEFWEGIQEKGGWWDPAYTYEEWDRVFQTPSRKYEFSSQILQRRLEAQKISGGNTLQALKTSGSETKGDRLFLPHWEPTINTSAESEKDYPFHLNVFQLLVFAGSTHINDPYLLDMSSLNVKEKWNSWVEINPHTAHNLGIKDGDSVWVESPAGKLKFRVKLTPGAMPQVVNIPLGLGHTASGRWAKGAGENALRLLTSHREPFTGEPLMHNTRVKVYKA